MHKYFALSGLLLCPLAWADSVTYTLDNVFSVTVTDFIPSAFLNFAIFPQITIPREDLNFCNFHPSPLVYCVGAFFSYSAATDSSIASILYQDDFAHSGGLLSSTAYPTDLKHVGTFGALSVTRASANEPVVTPEPATFLLVPFGALALWRFRKQKTPQRVSARA